GERHEASSSHRAASSLQSARHSRAVITRADGSPRYIAGGLRIQGGSVNRARARESCSLKRWNADRRSIYEHDSRARFTSTIHDSATAREAEPFGRGAAARWPVARSISKSTDRGPGPFVPSQTSKAMYENSVRATRLERPSTWSHRAVRIATHIVMMS